MDLDSPSNRLLVRSYFVDRQPFPYAERLPDAWLAVADRVGLVPQTILMRTPLGWFCETYLLAVPVFYIARRGFASMPRCGELRVLSCISC